MAARTYALLLTSLEGELFETLQEPGGLSKWAGASSLLTLVYKSVNAGGASAPAPGAAVAPSQPSLLPGAEQKYLGTWQSLTFECGDSPNPRPPAKFLALNNFAYAHCGPIGVVDLWDDEPCASWPVKASDRYVGPWNHVTPNAILLIGNTHDPATPYGNSVGMSRELAKSRVLTVDGYGHTVLL